jgi:hypothetical protein
VGRRGKARAWRPDSLALTRLCTVEFLFEILFELFGELLLQIVAEILFEIGLRSIAAPFKTKPNPYLATLGYVLFGATAGGLSLWAFPSLFIGSHAGRIANAIVTPFIAGGCMMAIGAWRRRRNQELILLDRFAYGYLFALVMALVRLRFGG